MEVVTPPSTPLPRRMMVHGGLEGPDDPSNRDSSQGWSRRATIGCAGLFLVAALALFGSVQGRHSMEHPLPMEHPLSLAVIGAKGPRAAEADCPPPCVPQVFGKADRHALRAGSPASLSADVVLSALGAARDGQRAWGRPRVASAPARQRPGGGNVGHAAGGGEVRGDDGGEAGEGREARRPARLGAEGSGELRDGEYRVRVAGGRVSDVRPAGDARARREGQCCGSGGRGGAAAGMRGVGEEMSGDGWVLRARSGDAGAERLGSAGGGADGGGAGGSEAAYELEYGLKRWLDDDRRGAGLLDYKERREHDPGDPAGAHGTSRAEREEQEWRVWREVREEADAMRMLRPAAVQSDATEAAMQLPADGSQALRGGAGDGRAVDVAYAAPPPVPADAGDASIWEAALARASHLLGPK